MVNYSQLNELINKYNTAWNEHDIETIVSMHTEDSVFCNHTSGGEAVGHNQIRELLKSILKTFPDIHFEGRSLYVREDLIVQEWTASATHINPIKYKDTYLEPTGKKISWNGMDIIPLRNGKIARKDVYADSITYLRQLGAQI